MFKKNLGLSENFSPVRISFTPRYVQKKFPGTYPVTFTFKGQISGDTRPALPRK